MHIRSGLQQKLYDRSVTVRAGSMQRSGTSVLRDIDVSACIQQHPNNLRMAVPRCDEKRCRSIIDGQLDVGPKLQHETGYSQVSVLGCNKEWRGAIICSALVSTSFK
mmetsp:Transcript_27368/g.57504  ORF Transcript_27368/g.57504 Transcript_27368/m.57504 type:complete len:107 (-) Transcript_27368:26-346(-)